MRGDFEANLAILLSLAILPNAVVAKRWKDAADEWVNSVQKTICSYKDLLPSTITLTSELKAWRHPW